MPLLSILSDELANDPLGRGYSSMTDQEAADSLNTVNRDYFVEIDSRQMLLWSGANNRYKSVLGGRGNANAGNVAEIGALMVQRDATAYDPNNPSHVGLIDLLISEGILEQADKDDLHAMGRRTQSRVAEIGILGYSVTAQDVSSARG